MASDQSVALDVKVPTYDAASPLLNAQSILGNQTKLQAGQTQLQVLQRQNAGQDIQFRNQLIANAAAHGIDSDAWNAAFQEAVDKGAPEAAQYIGRYTPLLQQRLFQAYSGAPAGGAAASGATGATPASGVSNDLDRMYANVSPAQMAQSLQKNNLILGALSTVHDQASYNTAIAKLAAAGIPNAAQIAGPYNPMRVIQLWNDTQQRVNYLQSRVAAASTGSPNPPIKTEMQVVGDVGYDPYNPGRQLTPAKPEKIGTDLGGDIYGVRDPNAPGGFRRIDTQTLGAAGGPVSFETAVSRLQPTENATGNPAAKNPLSSAEGDYQFTNKTWLDTVRAAMPDLSKRFSDQQILSLRDNPTFSHAMAIEFAKSNAAELAKASVPVTTATLTMAHKLGAGDAEKVFNAAPNTPMDRIVSPAVMKANPQFQGQTAGSYVQGIVRRVGNDAIGGANTVAGGQKFDPAKLPEGVDPTTGIDPKTGRNEGFLLSQPQQDRGLLKGLANYDIDPNAVGYRQKAQVQAKLATYDPTYRSDIYPIIKSTEEAFAKGKQGDQVRYFNNAIQHMTTLQRYADAMENGNTRVLNSLKNTIQTQLGVAAPNTFNGLKDVVGQEIVKSIVPGGGGEHEREEVAKKLSQASSPGQLTGMLEGYKELGGAQLRDLKVQYENGTYHKRNDFEDKLIPESRAALDKVLKNGTPGTGEVTAGLTPPVPGAKLYQGQWYTRGPNGEAVPVKR